MKNMKIFFEQNLQFYFQSEQKQIKKEYSEYNMELFNVKSAPIEHLLLNITEDTKCKQELFLDPIIISKPKVDFSFKNK